MVSGLQEKEIRDELAAGGRLREVVFVSFPVRSHTEHLAYILPSWRVHFLPLKIWGGKQDRPYRDLNRLLLLIREDFGYRGVIPIFLEDDPDLRHFHLVTVYGSSQPPSRKPP